MKAFDRLILQVKRRESGPARLAYQAYRTLIDYDIPDTQATKLLFGSLYVGHHIFVRFNEVHVDCGVSNYPNIHGGADKDREHVDDERCVNVGGFLDEEYDCHMRGERLVKWQRDGHEHINTVG